MRVQIEIEDGILDGFAVKGSKYPERGVLLLHPHPSYGGNMNNHVIRDFESALSKIGFTSLRFNFRSVYPSTNKYAGPHDSIQDAKTALMFMREGLNVTKVGVIGYSYGGSIALGVSILADIDFLVTLSASQVLLVESGIKLENLNSIKCPVLLVHGSDDTVIPISDMILLKSKIGARVVSFTSEHEGHFYGNNMKIVIDKVIDFIKAIWAINSRYE